MMDNKSLGEWVEMVFQCEATARGIIVSKPFGDNQQYDFIIDSGGTLLRVQVKGVSCREKGKNRYKIVFRRGSQTNKLGYTSDVDVFAVYVVPMNDWFIIPGSEIIGGRSIMSFYPDGSSSNSEKYRNNWDIITYYEYRNQVV